MFNSQAYYVRTMIGLIIVTEITRARNVGCSWSEGTKCYSQSQVGRFSEENLKRLNLCILWVLSAKIGYFGQSNVIFVVLVDKGFYTSLQSFPVDRLIII